MSSRNIVDKFGRKKKNQRVIIREKRGLGFKLTGDGNYDMQTKRLVNLGEPEQSTDAVTVGYVDDVTRQAKDLVLKALTESIKNVLREATIYFENQQSELKKLVFEHRTVSSNSIGDVNVKYQSMLQIVKHNREFFEDILTTTKSNILKIITKVDILESEIKGIKNFTIILENRLTDLTDKFI